jgi:hypothetical protein
LLFITVGLSCFKAHKKIKMDSYEYFMMNESTTNLIRLCQRMRKEKKEDLTDSNSNIVRYWDEPFSTDLHVVNGRMYDGDTDISRIFWDEVYWLYSYFNTQYYNDEDDDNEYSTYNDSEDEYDHFDGTTLQSFDFITFLYDNNRIDYMIPFERRALHISRHFKCDLIYNWLKFQLKKYVNGDVDSTFMMDIKHVGEMLPTITWKADGLILPLFGTKYHDLIEGSIQSLVDTYVKERVEYLISCTLNTECSEEFSPNTFWQQQFRNVSNDEQNQFGTRNQLLELLDIFKKYGLNILTLEVVKKQSLACNACPRSVTFERVQGTRILIERFGFEVLAFPGDYEDKRQKIWDWERYPPLISDMHITYEVLRANLDFIVSKQSYGRKRKYHET